MVFFREVEEGLYLLTDQDNKPLYHPSKLKFDDWLSLLPKGNYFIQQTYPGQFHTSSPALEEPLSIDSLDNNDLQKLEEFCKLTLVCKDTTQEFEVYPEQIGLKWTHIYSPSRAVQLEKKVFLGGPNAICWVPNLKAARVLELEGWTISESPWSLIPEAYQEDAAGVECNEISDHLFSLRPGFAAWIRVGGRPEDEFYAEARFYQSPTYGVVTGQIFELGESSFYSSASNSLGLSLEQLVRKNPIYRDPSFWDLCLDLIGTLKPGNSNVGTFGPRLGELRKGNRNLLNGTYSETLAQLVVQVLRDQQPKRLVIGLSEGWDFLLSRAAIAANIPVTVVWTEVSDLNWDNETLQCKQEILNQSEVVEVKSPTGTKAPDNPFSAGYEQFRIDLLRLRDRKVVELSDVIASAYESQKSDRYYALNYARQLGKPIVKYWDNLSF